MATREEARLSQEELANLIFRKRLTVSEMENGKVEISALTLVNLAIKLNIPLYYFFPPLMQQEIVNESLNVLGHDLISNLRGNYDDHLRKVAQELVKAVANFDPIETLSENIDIALENKEREEALKRFYPWEIAKTKTSNS